MDCVIRMHKLNLLPDSVLLLESDNPEVARRTLPRATSRMRSGSASSILSRALSRCSPRIGVSRDMLVRRGGHDLRPGGAPAPSQPPRLSCHALAKWLEHILRGSRPSIEMLSQCARCDVASLPPCSLISLEGADQGNQEASQRELRATQSTVECIEACRIDEIFADSKFLKAESLHELVKAIMWVSGPVMRIAATGEDSDVAEVSCVQQGHPSSA